jgi:ADP-ribose pyrophosphatase YjhB (NUDIX family)
MNPLLQLAYWLMRLKWRILRPITVGVRILLVQEQKVVLVSHSYQKGWQFPGGGVKWGETLAGAAIREAREEVGAQLLGDPILFGLYTNVSEGKSDHVVLFLSETFVLGQPTDRWEIRRCELFDLNALPPELGAGYRRRLQEYGAGQWPYVGRW